MWPYFCQRLVATASIRIVRWEMFADIEELEKMDASETHARRLNAKELVNARQW